MSKVNFYFDKKQLPQILGLVVLSTGMLGYFTWRILTPPPPERASAAVKIHGHAKVAATTSPTDLEMIQLTSGAAPTATMQDPFVSAMVPVSNDPVSETIAKLQNPVISDRSIVPMPYANLIKPLSGLAPGTSVAVAPAPVPWSVTGVLADSDSSKKIAVLRDGDERRFVVLGSMVDDQYRLIGIDRYGVTLTLGKSRIRLALGAAKTTVPAAPVVTSGTQAPGLLSSATIQSLANQTLPAITGTTLPTTGAATNQSTTASLLPKTN